MSDAPPTKLPRVAIVCRNLSAGAGGMERTAANLATHMDRQGYEVAVLYNQRQGDASLYHIGDGVARRPFDSTVASLVETVEAYRPDVIVFFYSTAFEAPHIAGCTQTGIPVVLHEGSNPDRVVGTNWSLAEGLSLEEARIERLAMMSVCTRIRFTLPHYRDSLPPVLRESSVAFPNAFAPADPADMGLRDAATRKIFLNIGGLKKVKNVMAAVRAFAMIADDLPDWDFHIFSAKGHKSPVWVELEAYLARTGLASRVKVFPPTPQIGREYGRSHVHVIASKEEGLPNCIAEASRHGLPSIGFACCAGTNAMIVPDHNGLLVACGENEIAALADAMRKAATNDEDRARWGRTALEESDIYDPDRIFAQWEALIVEAAADRSTPEARLRRRFGEGDAWRRLRAVQRASLGADPWPAPKRASFDEVRPVVSIIVPLFNKESYIAETLTSIAACSYHRTEVIVVDDVSTDNSASIAAEICAEHGWRLIRHAVNGGLSVARNTGLDAATGDYVHFWDADDVYAQDGIETILRAMHENGADIGTGIATRDGEVIGRYAATMKDIAATTYARTPESFATASSCFKVYDRAFLIDNGLRFEPGLFMQDSAFNLCAFPLAERITMTSAILGEYRHVEDSGARQYHPARYTSALKIDELTRDFYATHGLHALEPLRQRHILATVFASFVRRARRNHTMIDAAMSSRDLDFDFLEKLQGRLQELSAGLVTMTKPSANIRLAYFAIREGYLNWVPDLVRGSRPDGIRTNLLAATPEEARTVNGLLAKL